MGGVLHGFLAGAMASVSTHKADKKEEDYKVRHITFSRKKIQALILIEGEQKKSTQTFLSLEAKSYRPECFKAFK